MEIRARARVRACVRAWGRGMCGAGLGQEVGAGLGGGSRVFSELISWLSSDWLRTISVEGH